MADGSEYSSVRSFYDAVLFVIFFILENVFGTRKNKGNMV